MIVDRRAELLELAAPARGGRARRLPGVAAGPARQPTSTGGASPASAGSASPPAPRRPEVLVEEVIDAFAERFAVKVEVVTAAEEAVAFNLPRALREVA